MLEVTTKKNGLTVACEPIAHMRSVAVGVWVRAGSQNEDEGNNGVSHFIEHMVFKGTAERSAKDLAVAMDRIGGQMNAFTSKECTCFHVKVMDEHLPQAMDILADLTLHASLSEEEMKKEKGVIIEEINMVEDTPEDLVHELASRAHWKDDPLARTILGPADNIKRMSRADLAAYRSRMYVPGNCVLAVAGKYDKAVLDELIERCFGAWAAAPVPPRLATAPELARAVLLQEKDIEQAHLCLGFPGVPADHEDSYPLAVLSNMLGGGMSSRLFQRIREERGLAYSVYTYPTSYQRCGALSVYAGMSQENAQQVVRLIAQELKLFVKEGPAPQELDDAKEQLKGSYILSQESGSARMSAIGRQMLLRGRVLAEEEVLRRITAVSMDDVRRVAAARFGGGFSAAAVGKLPKGFDIPALMQG